jgi:23S rRNA pseudouridine2605 synthase
LHFSIFNLKFAMNSETSPQRLNKYLALCGFGSRRSVEDLIRAGSVTIGGEVVTDLARRVTDEDKVAVNGRPARPPSEHTYILFNKPPGYLCSRSDPFGRPIIYDLLPEKYRRLHYVGRLDFQSRGLLLLTTDGDWTQGLLHPSHEVPRTYLVQTESPLSRHDADELREGVRIGPDETAKAVSVKPAEAGWEITLKEGKKREIRRMLEVLDHKVIDLQRIRFGGLELGDVPEGKFRPLNASEIARLHEREVP